jgi:DUF1365 family protein
MVTGPTADLAPPPDVGAGDHPTERPTGRPGLGFRSAVYEGTVVHRRPGADGHRFTMPVRMALLDLDEVDDVLRLHPLCSATRPAPLRFRRSDYLGDPEVPLASSVRDLVADRTGHRPTGPISVLTNLRSWGWLFNPISCYFCFDEDGAGVEWMVAEVTNTPWHQRHAYVVGPPGTHRFAKAMHVSPFLPMDLDYRVEYAAPSADLRVAFTVVGSDGMELYAGLSMGRRPVSRRSLARLVWAPRRGTMGVSFGIYRQALGLWRKGTRFHPHPDRRPKGDADTARRLRCPQ